MPDVAALQFQIDSSQANTASDNLKKMAEAAAKTQKSLEQLIAVQQRQILMLRELVGAQLQASQGLGSISSAAGPFAASVALNAANVNGLRYAFISFADTLSNQVTRAIDRMNQSIVQSTHLLGGVDVSHLTRSGSMAVEQIFRAAYGRMQVTGVPVQSQLNAIYTGGVFGFTPQEAMGAFNSIQQARDLSDNGRMANLLAQLGVNPRGGTTGQVAAQAIQRLISGLPAGPARTGAVGTILGTDDPQAIIRRIQEERQRMSMGPTERYRFQQGIQGGLMATGNIVQTGRTDLARENLLRNREAAGSILGNLTLPIRRGFFDDTILGRMFSGSSPYNIAESSLSNRIIAQGAFNQAADRNRFLSGIGGLFGLPPIAGTPPTSLGQGLLAGIRDFSSYDTGIRPLFEQGRAIFGLGATPGYLTNRAAPPPRPFSGTEIGVTIDQLADKFGHLNAALPDEKEANMMAQANQQLARFGEQFGVFARGIAEGPNRRPGAEDVLTQAFGGNRDRAQAFLRESQARQLFALQSAADRNFGPAVQAGAQDYLNAARTPEEFATRQMQMRTAQTRTGNPLAWDQLSPNLRDLAQRLFQGGQLAPFQAINRETPAVVGGIGLSINAPQGQQTFTNMVRQVLGQNPLGQSFLAGGPLNVGQIEDQLRDTVRNATDRTAGDQAGTLLTSIENLRSRAAATNALQANQLGRSFGPMIGATNTAAGILRGGGSMRAATMARLGGIGGGQDNAGVIVGYARQNALAGMNESSASAVSGMEAQTKAAQDLARALGTTTDSYKAYIDEVDASRARSRTEEGLRSGQIVPMDATRFYQGSINALRQQRITGTMQAIPDLIGQRSVAGAAAASAMEGPYNMQTEILRQQARNAGLSEDQVTQFVAAQQTGMNAQGTRNAANAIAGFRVQQQVTDVALDAGALGGTRPGRAAVAGGQALVRMLGGNRNRILPDTQQQFMQQYVATANQQEDLRNQQEQMQAVSRASDLFVQSLQDMTSGLSNASLTMRSFGANIAQMGANQLLWKPLSSFANNVFSLGSNALFGGGGSGGLMNNYMSGNWFGVGDMLQKQVMNRILGSVIGGGSGGGAMGALSAAFSGLFSGGGGGGALTGFGLPDFLFGSARGNIFYHGSVVPFASGGVVDRPSVFPLAGGRAGMAGEAGPEAIVPLRRGLDGRLGIASSGGAGVVINAPINVSSQGGSQIKQSELNDIHRQLTTTVYGAVKGVLSNEMLPGGSLYGGSTYGPANAR